MADNQYLNGSAAEGELASPFADEGAHGDASNLASPFDQGQTADTQDVGMWESIKSTFGARADAMAAGLLQDTGSDKSRYAMKRAERTNNEARAKEAQLSGIEKFGAGVADIGTGLALTAAGTALAGPAGGAAAGGAYFGAESMADQLRHDAETSGRYDLTKAAGVGLAQGIAGEVTGGLANRAVGVAAPVVGQAINKVSGAVLPAAGRAVGAVVPAITEPLGYLAGKNIGQTIGKYTGKAINATVVPGTEAVGKAVIPTLTDLATHVVTSKGGQAIVGGGATGSAMQAISNVANGRPVTEGTGEAFLHGAAAGGFIHGVSPAVGAISRRLPTTLRVAKENVLGTRGRYRGEEGEAPAPTGPEPMPESPTGGEGRLNPEPTQEGAIPAAQQPLHAPFAEGNAVPGMESFNPADYGRGPQGAWRNVQPGQGIGPGGPMNNLPGVSDTTKGTIDALYNAFGKSGLLGMFSKSGARDAARADRTYGVENVPENSRLLNESKKTTAVLDVQHQMLEQAEPGSPEFQTLVNSINETSLKHGGAASETMSNQLAMDVDLPMTAKYHDRELKNGVASTESTNPALEAGYTKEQVNREHTAVMESEASAIPGQGEANAEDVAAGLTYEAHFNKVQKSYQRAADKVENSMRDNLKLTNETNEMLKHTGSNEESRRAAELHEDMKDYDSILTSIGNGKEPSERLQVLNRRIIENANYLGLAPQLKNILGETGTFNPAINAQSWHNFNEGVRQMHPQAPKGSYKDQVKEQGLGLEKVGINPMTWIKPIQKVVKRETNKELSAGTQARAAAIARKGALRPERAENLEVAQATEAALRRGDMEGAQASAEDALASSGINAEGPELGATPAAEMAAETTAPTADAATRAHVDTLLRGSRDIVEAQNAQNVSQMAEQPRQVTPQAPEPQQAAEPIAPAEVPAEAATGAPAEPAAPAPGTFAQGNEAAPRLPEQGAEAAPAEAAPTAGQGVPQKPQRTLQEIAQEAPAEPTVDVTKPLAPEEIQNMTDGELYRNMGEASDRAAEGDTVAQQNFSTMSDALETRRNPAPAEQAPAEAAQEGPQASPEQMATQPSKLGEAPATEAPAAPEVNNVQPPKLKEPPAEAKAVETQGEKPADIEDIHPVDEGEAPKAEPAEKEVDVETHSMKEPISTEVTDKREGESYEERNKRVANMAKRLVESKIEKTLKAPVAKAPLKEKAEARNMQRAITSALELAKDKADKENVHYADVLAAVMNQEGGIHSLFNNGYGKNEITGRINAAVTQFRNKQRSLARDGIDEAGKIVRRHLKAVGETRAARDDKISASLEAAGYTKEEIKSAFDKAEARTPGAYTMRHVVDYAKSARRAAKAATPAPKKPGKSPMKQTKEGFSKWVNNLGVDLNTKIALQKIIENHTKEGTGESGVRGPLSDKQFDAVMKDLHQELLDRAQGASTAAREAVEGPQKERAIKRDQQLSEAVKTAQQTEGSAKAGNDEILQGHAQEITRQAAEKKRAEEQAAADREAEAKAEAALKNHEEDLKKAEQAAAEEIHEEANKMNDEEVRQFGSVLTEEMPSSFDGHNDPDFTRWKLNANEAVKQLRARGDHKEANFIEKFSSMLDTGLKRASELPDRKDLTMSSDDYEHLRALYISMKKGENADPNVAESLGTQFGTVGVRMRTLLQGHSGAARKLYNSKELKREREKALYEKNNRNGDELNTAGIKNPD